MRLTLKLNSFNNMTKICCDSDTKIVGNLKQIYKYNHKMFVDLSIDDNNANKVMKIESLILEQYPSLNTDLKLVSNIQNDVFTHLKIPMKYDMIMINIQTRNGKRMLIEHLETNMDIACKISCNYVYETVCNELKITWSIDDIIANCIYT